MSDSRSSSSSGSSSRTSSAGSSSSSSFMSSSPSPIYPPTFTDPTPDATQSPGGGNDDGGNNGNPTASASLYLYTFLATLVLLLGVSSAIVIRSLVLRRRHRRLIEEAIRNGTWVPPVSGRGARIDPANKPKMHEAHLSDVRDRDLAWSGVMPMYACYHKDTTSPPHADTAAPLAALPPRRQHIFQSLIARASRSATPSGTSTPVLPTSTNTTTNASHPLTTLPTTNPALATGAAASLGPGPGLAGEDVSSASALALRGSAVDLTTAAGPSEPQRVHVAFIIAMPSSEPIRPPPPGHEDEAELPELQVGFAEVTLADPAFGVHAGEPGEDKVEGVSARYGSGKSLDVSDGEH